MTESIVCSPRTLPRDKWILAADNAVRINPMNLPSFGRLAMAQPGLKLSPEAMAMSVTRYWRTAGVNLTVSFLDNPAADLRARILSHMNAWGKTAKVKFVETAADGQVRIARATGPKDGGYWVLVGNGNS